MTPSRHTIQVEIPYHLATLAGTGRTLSLDLPAGASVTCLLDIIEERYPMLRGTIRDHTTRERRPFLRFFACCQDLSHEPADQPLPSAVLEGAEPFIILGSIAGG